MENRKDRLVEWTAPECPFEIEYDPGVLERIGRKALDSLSSLPRGGLEIGGLLLGSHRETGVVIRDSISFDCEHAFGPLFILSQRDEERLGAMVAATRAGANSEIVGWYHSHNRSDIFLSAADQGVYGRFFAEPWHVALVVRPNPEGTVKAGFFFWERDKSLHAEASYCEFMIDSALAAPTLSPASADPSRVQPVAARAPKAVEASADSPDPEERTTFQPTLSAVEAADTTPVADPPDPLSAPDPPDSEAAPPQPVCSRRWIASAILLLGSIAGAGFFGTRMWSARERPPDPRPGSPAVAALIRLVTIEENGQLQILWDPSVPVVQHSTGATLDIQDGGEVRNFSIEPPQLQTGSFTYARQSERVVVTLSISRPDGGNLVQVTTFVGRSGKPPSEAANFARERDELAAEAARLKSELAKQTERTKRLERLVELLRKSPGDRPQKTVPDTGSSAGK
jgi:proteasome lid subunit RPN8/RPN11